MSRPANDTFAARFDAALREDGRTNEQFARDIDVTQRQVYRWRRGESAPTGASLVTLAAALGREPAWFYDGDPNGEPEPEGVAA